LTEINYIQEQITFITVVATLSIPVGLFLVKSMNDFCKRLSRLEGRHIQIDSEPHDLEDK